MCCVPRDRVPLRSYALFGCAVHSPSRFSSTKPWSNPSTSAYISRHVPPRRFAEKIQSSSLSERALTRLCNATRSTVIGSRSIVMTLTPAQNRIVVYLRTAPQSLLYHLLVLAITREFLVSSGVPSRSGSMLALPWHLQPESLVTQGITACRENL